MIIMEDFFILGQAIKDEALNWEDYQLQNVMLSYFISGHLAQ